MTEQSSRTLGGVFCPVVTTFRGDETIDRDAFLTNVRAHLADGVHGIVVCGSSGEAALLDEDERGDLVGWAREAVPRERWLVSGCGGESTRIVVKRAREAARRGADAVLVVSPHYYLTAMTREALLGIMTSDRIRSGLVVRTASSASCPKSPSTTSESSSAWR